MRSAVMALPRADGNAKGVSNAARGAIAGKHTGIGNPRPDVVQRIGRAGHGIL